MDDMEDDARYPAKPYALNPYNPSNRPRNPVRNAPFSHPINRYEVEDDDENDDEFDEENDQQEDEDDEEDENPNGYYRSFEEDGEFDRHPKKRKLRNSGYELVPRSDAKASYSARNPKAEWTEHAVFVLLEVWGDRFLQLGRKSLRSEDWNDVAEKVSEASKMERTEVQCRTMLDKLKRKYKKEKAKVEEMGLNSSKWVYFKKMDMLMGSSTGQDFGLACGFDSGEYVFMNTLVYLERSNGFDEMRDSPGESENEEEEKEDELPPRRPVRGGGEGSSLSYRVLADSIQKFGEIYEKIESSKRQQMMELEKMRLEFQRELELQKKQILERAQAEIAKMQEEDDDDEDSDASEENLSE
jgi:hypothetical protein